MKQFVVAPKVGLPNKLDHFGIVRGPFTTDHLHILLFAFPLAY
jgi:hypothetical protein